VIISRLLGGLGNQMFQYAIGRYLSLKYNVELKLDTELLLWRSTDPNYVPGGVYRNYDLDIFKNINAEVGNFKGGMKIIEPHFHFYPNILDILDNNKDVYLEGYWQTYKYFESISDIIKKDFTFKNKLSGSSENLMKEIQNTNSVLINVRRTDYLNKNFHGIMGNEYIMKGVDIIKSKIDDPHYFIFSDDIKWCEENIKLDNMTIVDHSHKGDRFDFYFQLMIECKHFIIPNSSFGWWAAWLNKDNEKIVIAPIKWFNNDYMNTNDLIPQNWIRI